MPKTGRVLGVILALFLWVNPFVFAHAEESPAIRVAVEGAYPPFNYIDQNNELQGFEVDLAKALCEAMRSRCTFVTHGWDGIIRALLANEYDAIMSSLEILERRQKRIAFSEPYYRVPVAFIGRKDATIQAVTPKALAGLRIGTNDHDEQFDYLQANYKDSEIKRYSKLEEANLDLLTDRLDLVLGDRFGLAKFLESREGAACCRIVGDVPARPAFRYQTYGIGVRKEDTALLDSFNAALRQVIADGTYDRVRAKYFPFDIK
ncbi:transporter substrate-binding domain-containing protein [Microvirga pudoricolor]|uniref:transporter substrate-binding domain-containing protein n=1 Tax=Microvirga pudoricolor TaxID=2778729 RepID=UPI0019500FBF|nr:transporter substrate-binding domain-containing protein [Microvirga pudoricolor]MBM6594640.1 transporter substrate-binding domain-containing protein [Microvirga pudoricolor]